MNVQEFAELAAGFALDALSPDDEHAFRVALAEHPEWAAIAEADAATAAVLAEGVAEVEPPAGIRAALLAQIAPGSAVAEAELASEPEPEPEPEPELALEAVEPAAVEPAAVELEPEPGLELESEPGLEREPGPEPEADPARPAEPAPSTEAVQTVARRNWTRGLLALAASFILLVALGTAVVLIGDRLRAPASVVALDEIQAASDAQSSTVDIEDGGTATAHWSDSVGKAVLVTTDLPPTAADETYELWFVRDGSAVSAGLFEADDSGGATTLLDGAVEEGDVIAVTVEPEGGSPTGQPSSDPIFAIPTA